MERAMWYWFHLVTLIATVSISLASDSTQTCGKSTDIDLRTHSAFMSYALQETTYEENKAFDRNNETIILTYFDINMQQVPAQYLDNGYNWVMVELDKDKFQLVDSVTLIVRKYDFVAVRIRNIEVLVSNKMDYAPKRYTAAKAGEISWNNFVSCGNTGTASGDVTVGCSQNVMNSKYVAVRRDKESKPTTIHGYCCFDFAEFKVNLAAQLHQPAVQQNQWLENFDGSISSSRGTDCVLPNNLQLQWSLIMYNQSLSTLPGNSATLKIPNLRKENTGAYFYEVFSANNRNAIFKSDISRMMYVFYKSVLRNDVNTFYENNVTMISCSSTGGYPHPTGMSAQFMSITNSSAQFKNDAYYGKEAESSLQIIVDRSMNLQNLSCNLQQPNFSITTKRIPIIVYYGAGSLIVSNTRTQLNEGDTFEMICLTSDSGYPAPLIVITIGNDKNTTSIERIPDKYGGESVVAKFSATATKELHNMNVTCTLRQMGFPVQTKSLTLRIIVSDSPQVCNTACVALFSTTVVVLLIALIVGAVWVIKNNRRIKSNSGVQEESTESRPMEDINNEYINDISNKPVVEYENANEHLKSTVDGAPVMMDSILYSTERNEDLYEEPNDAENSTDIYINDG